MHLHLPILMKYVYSKDSWFLTTTMPLTKPSSPDTWVTVDGRFCCSCQYGLDNKNFTPTDNSDSLPNSTLWNWQILEFFNGPYGTHIIWSHYFSAMYIYQSICKIMDIIYTLVKMSTCLYLCTAVNMFMLFNHSSLYIIM